MRRVLAGLVALLAMSTGSAGADPGPYVALGDSYTSAPLVPLPTGMPLGCLRSDRGYPALVARALAVGAFTDVSCSSAPTNAMMIAQPVLAGSNPPQFDALRSDTQIVTIGIGANDISLIGVLLTCIESGLLAPNGTACRDSFALADGSDVTAAHIAATAPKVAGVLQGIRARAPLARIVLVGYPAVVPRTGNGCWPLVSMSPDGLRYVDEVIVRLNAMLAAQAAGNGVEFADTYDDSIGHDVCAGPPARWFEGVVPTSIAYPLHPNALGMQGMAGSVLRVLRSPRPARASGKQRPVHRQLRKHPVDVARIVGGVQREAQARIPLRPL